jgi:hypothetical protein
LPKLRTSVTKHVSARLPEGRRIPLAMPIHYFLLHIHATAYFIRSFNLHALELVLYGLLSELVVRPGVVSVIAARIETQ